jgi:serine/threonine-protein kinase
VKLIDFGVAHLVGAGSGTSLKGTLFYMAPEQVQLQKPTPLSDLFSLGVVCYEALTRRRPFDGATMEETIQAILHRTPPPASDLNSAITRPVSQVVHKAMAKQPWNRFASVREFGDCLQRAMRGEPLQLFDEARTAARIERAERALQNGEYEFANEVLTDLEAESYLHPDLPGLRRRLDFAVREKTVGQLLETARRYVEEDEQQLALQKIQEILNIDSAHAEAIALKTAIESARADQQIGQWMSLAQQHLQNHSYPHAREAVRNVFGIKPGDTAAQRLLNEIDLREQEYMRLRGRKEELYRAAMDAFGKGEVSAALSEMERVMELDRRAPETSAAGRAAAYQSSYQKVLSEHEALNAAYGHARRQLAAKEFQAALAICDESLAKYPGHALFQALRVDIEEAERQELSAFIARIDREVDAEPDLERRVAVLRDALQQRAGESHFERALQLVTAKRDLVNSIVVKARAYEERGQFIDALGQWEMLKNIHTAYPGLEIEIDRLRVRRDQQARAEARHGWVEQIDAALALGEWPRALDLAQSAITEFPEDAELKALETLARQGAANAAEAQALLDGARELCAAGKRDEAIGLLSRAGEIDPQNSGIRGALLDTLLKHASAIVETDPEGAALAAGRVLELDRGNALANSLRAVIDGRRRDEYVDGVTAEARQLQAAGSVDTALRRVEEALALYPLDARLAQLKSSLSRMAGETQAAQARRRDLEQAQAVERQAGTISDPAQLGAMLDQTAGLASRYSGDRDFESIVAFLRGRMEQATVAAPAPVPQAAAAVAPPADTRSPVPIPAPAIPLSRRAASRLRAISRALRPASRHLRYRWPTAAALAFVLAAATVSAWLLRPKTPKTVSAKISTLPQGAEVRIDGRSVGRAPGSFAIAPGDHMLRIALDGYHPLETKIAVSAAASCCEPVRLAPLSSLLRIWTDVAASRILLDEEVKAAPAPGEPLEIDSLPSGEHTLVLTANEGEARLRFQTAVAEAPRHESPQAPKGLRVFVLSTLGQTARFFAPVPSRVSIDGAPAIEIAADRVDLGGLAPGAHQIAIEEAGGSRREQTVVIGPAPAISIFVLAERAPEFGNILIRANESDLTILLDGRKRGSVRRRDAILVSGVTPGPHKLEIQKDGFRSEPELQTIQVRAGQSTEIAVNFVPRSSALVIRGAARDTQVVVDGSVAGAVGASGELIVPLSPGTHDVELRRRGYRNSPFTSTIGPGRQTYITGKEAVLERMTGFVTFKLEEPRQGVSVRIEPTKDVVDYNGETLPEVPARLELPAGSYKLTFSAKDYENHIANLQLVDRETKLISVTLHKR